MYGIGGFYNRAQAEMFGGLLAQTRKKLFQGIN